MSSSRSHHPSVLHPSLRRLDRLAEELAVDDDVLAVLGLGSAGTETARFDDHSDIDFFVVVDGDAAKQRFLADVGWLGGFGGRVAYSFVNDPNGRKALFEDGLFLEYAVFTPAELRAVPFAGARVVWSRPAFALSSPRTPPAPTALDTVEFHLNEALTNLFVGLHRELRGERLTAMRFIQVYAVDRVLALLRLQPGTAWDLPDPFDPTRRTEGTRAAADLPLVEMVAGYAHNAVAARATLGWLGAHFDLDPTITGAVEELLGLVPAPGPG